MSPDQAVPARHRLVRELHVGVFRATNHHLRPFDAESLAAVYSGDHAQATQNAVAHAKAESKFQVGETDDVPIGEQSAIAALECDAVQGRRGVIGRDLQDVARAHTRDADVLHRYAFVLNRQRIVARPANRNYRQAERVLPVPLRIELADERSRFLSAHRYVSERGRVLLDRALNVI